jgi:hypothetical protein
MMRQGRNAEAEHHYRISREGEGFTGSGTDLRTVVMTAAIAAAVVPFIQTLAAKAAEDSYAAARGLIRRLVRQHGTGGRSTGMSSRAPNANDGGLGAPAVQLSVGEDRNLGDLVAVMDGSCDRRAVVVWAARGRCREGPRLPLEDRGHYGTNQGQYGRDSLYLYRGTEKCCQSAQCTHHACDSGYDIANFREIVRAVDAA